MSSFDLFELLKETDMIRIGRLLLALAKKDYNKVQRRREIIAISSLWMLLLLY